jgi:hypothetical protein
MFRAEISEETLLSIPSIKGLIPEILLFRRKGAVSRDFSLRDGILPTLSPQQKKKGKRKISFLGKFFHCRTLQKTFVIRWCLIITL